MEERNKMNQHILKLQEELAAARAAGPEAVPLPSSPVSKQRPPELEELGSLQSPDVVRDESRDILSPQAATRNIDDFRTNPRNKEVPRLDLQGGMQRIKQHEQSYDQDTDQTLHAIGQNYGNISGR